MPCPRAIISCGLDEIWPISARPPATSAMPSLLGAAGLEAQLDALGLEIAKPLRHDLAELFDAGQPGKLQADRPRAGGTGAAGCQDRGHRQGGGARPDELPSGGHRLSP
jgi:hypothetical protein